MTNIDLSEQIKNITNNITNNNIEEFDGHLIVDDISGNRYILSKMLSILKINSDEAANGLEAIKMVAKRKYKMIWMDIKMPIMNGIESAKHIREDFNFDGPIYATTAYTDSITQEDCFNAGIDKIIPKPIGLKLIKDISKKINSDN